MKSINRVVVILVFISSSVTQNTDFNNFILGLHMGTFSSLDMTSPTSNLNHSHAQQHEHSHNHGHAHTHKAKNLQNSLDFDSSNPISLGSKYSHAKQERDNSETDSESHEHDHCFSSTANTSVILETLEASSSEELIAHLSQPQFSNQLVNEPHLRGLFRPPRS